MSKNNEDIKATVADLTIAEHDSELHAVATIYLTAAGQVVWRFSYMPGYHLPLLGTMELAKNALVDVIKTNHKAKDG